MTEFNFNLLTINGITKICDNNIYTFNKEIIQYQWHYFQLEYILNKIGIRNSDTLTGLKLTKNQICNRIKTYLTSNKLLFNTSDDSNYGFIPKKIKNVFSNDNLGGIPNKILVSNKLGTKINNKPNKYLIGEEAIIFEKNAREKLKKLTKKTTIFSKKKKTFSKKWTNPDSGRMSKALIQIPKWEGSQNFLNYGRLDWDNNSCWADSILVMIFFKIFEDSSIGDTINPIFSKYILEDIRTKLDIIESGEENLFNCFKPDDFDRSYPILKNISDNFKELYYKLNQQEIFRANKLIYNINQCPAKKGTENWTNGGYHDALDFFKIIFKIFNIPSEECNIKQTLKLNTRSVTYMENIDAIFRNDLEITDNFGGDPVSDLPIIQRANYSEIITKDIMTSDLEILKGLSLPDGVHVSLFLDHKVEQDVDLYKILNENTTQIVSERNSRFIVHNGDKIDITNGYDGPLAKHIPKIVNRYIINDTNHIFFGIHRLKLNIQFEESNFNNIKIIPDKFINLDASGNKNLFLRSIIVWYNNHYVTFFQKKDIWYLYNDMYSARNQDDYVVIIGSHDDLMNYKISGEITVLTNSVLIWYSI
jgi:hypothetical protein